MLTFYYDMQKAERGGMRNKRTFISFDWAPKHLLREKLTTMCWGGFVSVILRKKSIKMHRLQQSEGRS